MFANVRVLHASHYELDDMAQLKRWLRNFHSQYFCAILLISKTK